MHDAKFIHPGEHLELFLDELGIPHAQFAEALGVTTYGVSPIMNRRAPVTAKIATRIAKAFGQSAEFWMRLRQMHDIEGARATVDVSAIEPLPDDWEPPLKSEGARRRDTGQTFATVGTPTT
ncbi:MAG: HigA family addiction module antidote protein [Chloroflexi bacterium]|nr:HigA family addiction module antidote protein [Chloroflexota bacterium]